MAPTLAHRPPRAAIGVGVGTVLLTSLYLATPKDAKDRIRGNFKRGAEKSAPPRRGGRRVQCCTA